jgi:hypothetical protein
MNAAAKLVSIVEANGGHICIDGADLVIRPGKAAEPMLAELLRYKGEIIALLQSRATTPAEAPIDEGWGLWMLARCVYRDRCFGGIGALYVDLARWCADHGRPVPASRRAFVTALQAEGFAVTLDGLVYGLMLREDLEAHERFQAAEPAYNPNCKTGGHKSGHNTRKSKD